MCPFCDSKNSSELLSSRAVPYAQNFVFDTAISAKECAKGLIQIQRCLDCGNAFNSRFNKDLITYDQSYQNEQAHSKVFQDHLNDVLTLIKRKKSLDSIIIEVGCGKGHFVDALLEAGYNSVKGFDTAYEGNSSNIYQQHFGPDTNIETSDLLVLRHVLEHIDRPCDFLLNLAKANHYQGLMYVEVPDMNWIIENRAFWDLNHEHANYFDRTFFEQNFANAEIYELFGGQYLGVFLSISDLKDYQPPSISSRTLEKAAFEDSLTRMKIEFDNWQRIYLWGASSKGVLLCNYLDSHCTKINGLIDINPRKWKKFVPGTGHEIFSPDEYLPISAGSDIITIVANENYLAEVKSLLPADANVISIEQLVRS